MLNKAVQHNDWKSKYQATLEELRQRECEWEKIKGLLRKTIARLSIAGRGLDARLDQHLRVIQQISREELDEKLEQALKQFSSIVSSLGSPQSIEKSNRSDPIMLVLELLQEIHFDRDQRHHLKDIVPACSKPSPMDRTVTLSAAISRN